MYSVCNYIIQGVLIMTKRVLIRILIISILVICALLLIIGSLVQKKTKESSLSSEIIKLLDVEVPSKEILDLKPKVEEVFINYAKNKVFEDSYKMFSRTEGIEYNQASEFVLNLGILSSICEGDTYLYKKDVNGKGKFLNKFSTNKNDGNSYFQISNKLSSSILSKKYENNKINDYYLRGSVLTAHLYINPENWTKVILEKDPYKYIEAKVTINEKIN